MSGRIKCITGEVVYSYRDYLKTDHWFELRGKCLERCGGICQQCGRYEATEIHHKTYDHLGNESISELLPLCSNCHAREHEDSEDRKLRIAIVSDRIKRETDEIKRPKQKPKQKQATKQQLKTHYTRFRFKDGTPIPLCLEESVKKQGFIVPGLKVSRGASETTCWLCCKMLRK